MLCYDRLLVLCQICCQNLALVCLPIRLMSVPDDYFMVFEVCSSHFALHAFFIIDLLFMGNCSVCSVMHGSNKASADSCPSIVVDVVVAFELCRRFFDVDSIIIFFYPVSYIPSVLTYFFYTFSLFWRCFIFFLSFLDIVWYISLFFYIISFNLFVDVVSYMLSWWMLVYIFLRLDVGLYISLDGCWFIYFSGWMLVYIFLWLDVDL